MRPATELVRFAAAPDDPHHPTATPIYQTATFEQRSPVQHDRYDYTRSGNPTRTVLEDQIARLESAHRAFAFTSGMAALSAVTRLVPAGGRIVAGDDLYGGTYRLLSRIVTRLGITVTYADLTELDAAAAVLGRTADASRTLVLVETPTNPLLRVADVRALATLTHARGALLAVDASFLSPLRLRPLELGADISIHSATKLLSGHGDVTAGTVAVRDERLADEIAFLQNAEGAALAPFEAWLLLRGMKTLALRLERQEATAHRLAEALRAHPVAKRVRFPGLAAGQTTGAGCVVSFETGSLDVSRRLVETLRLFTLAVSFGSVASSVSLPCFMSHASIPEDVRRARALPEDLVRISAGIEDPADLEADLIHALDLATEALPCGHVRQTEDRVRGRDGAAEGLRPF